MTAILMESSLDTEEQLCIKTAALQKQQLSHLLYGSTLTYTNTQDFTEISSNTKIIWINQRNVLPALTYRFHLARLDLRSTEHIGLTLPHAKYAEMQKLIKFKSKQM